MFFCHCSLWFCWSTGCEHWKKKSFIAKKYQQANRGINVKRLITGGAWAQSCRKIACSNHQVQYFSYFNFMYYSAIKHLLPGHTSITAGCIVNWNDEIACVTVWTCVIGVIGLLSRHAKHYCFPNLSVCCKESHPRWANVEASEEEKHSNIMILIACYCWTASAHDSNTVTVLGPSKFPQ